jgi:hypothetical protein
VVVAVEREWLAGFGGGCSEWRLKRMTEVRATVEDDSRRAQVREERRRRSSRVARRPTLASRAGAAWGWPGEGALIGCARLAPAASATLEPTVTSDSTTACLA